MEWYEVVINILSGLVATIPLVIQLVKYVRKAIQEKNWSSLMSMAMNFIAEAEEKFDNGADRKEWVMGMIECSAKSINYPVDLDQMSVIVDNLCSMSKNVNVTKCA